MTKLMMFFMFCCLITTGLTIGLTFVLFEIIRYNAFALSLVAFISGGTFVGVLMEIRYHFRPKNFEPILK